MSDSPALDLSDCVLRLDARTVFRLDRFAAAAGDRVAITGPSGCGKSTLLHLVSGLLRADSGAAEVLGRDLSRLGGRARDRFRGRAMGFVHQTFNLLPHFDALENVRIGLRFGRAVPRRQWRERAREALEEVGLGHRVHHAAHRLSIGEQQRVAVARAIVNRPRLLLADEPTGSLDPDTGAQVFGLLDRLASETGATLLVVTHDLELAARLPQRFDAQHLVVNEAREEGAAA